jgi:hypothetical protein
MSNIKISVSATKRMWSAILSCKYVKFVSGLTIANPVRDDQGIKVVHDVSILETSSAKNTKME